jgi:hypothetical protein
MVGSSKTVVSPSSGTSTSRCAAQAIALRLRAV